MGYSVSFRFTEFVGPHKVIINGSCWTPDRVQEKYIYVNYGDLTRDYLVEVVGLARTNRTAGSYKWEKV